MFDPTLPATGSLIRSAELRNQFNALNNKIDNLPAPSVPTLAAVLMASNNAAGNSLANLAALNFSGSLIISTVSGVMRLDSNVPLIIKAAHGPEVTFGADGLAYTPANPGHWAGSPPASLAEAIDRLAAAVTNGGASPVP